VNAPDPSTAPKEPRVTTRATIVKKRDSIEESDSPALTTPVIDGTSSGFEKMMKKRQEKKFDARIARLVKELNLTPEQEKELRAQWSKKTEGLAEMMRSGKGMENVGDIAKLMSGSGIEENLSSPTNRRRSSPLSKDGNLTTASSHGHSRASQN